MAGTLGRKARQSMWFSAMAWWRKSTKRPLPRAITQPRGWDGGNDCLEKTASFTGSLMEEQSKHSRTNRLQGRRGAAAQQGLCHLRRTPWTQASAL